MDLLDTHRPNRPDYYNEDLPPKVASTGCTSAMSELAAFGLHSTCLTEEVSRPFGVGEGINEGLIEEEAGAIGGTDPEDLEGALVLGELFEIALGEFGLDRLLMGGIDQSNAGALEACT